MQIKTKKELRKFINQLIEDVNIDSPDNRRWFHFLASRVKNEDGSENPHRREWLEAELEEFEEKKQEGQKVINDLINIYNELPS